MKNLIEQFYTEGFATTFYQKPVKYINKHVNKKSVSKLLTSLIKIFYTLIFIAIGIIVLYEKLF